MNSLERTESRESTKSTKSNTHNLSSATSSVSSRKGRSADADTSNGNVERASISMPRPASTSIARHYPSRRPSKASDILSSAANSTNDLLLQQQSASLSPSGGEASSAATPTIEGIRTPKVPPFSLLPHAAPQTTTIMELEPDQPDQPDTNRLSFSSVFSVPAAIYHGATRIAGSYAGSIAGSVAESEPDGSRGLWH
jgi:uncharacterized membrane protein